MVLMKEDKAKIILEHGKSDKNTGSTEVQIGLLTARINDLTGHFKTNKKDTNSRRGLLKLVGQRRRLLKYLQRVNINSYRELLEKLALRK